MKLFILITFAFVVSCSSNNASPPNDGELMNVDAISLYTPLLDNIQPSDCQNNCIWPLRGTEWRLEKFTDDTGAEARVAPETVHTLLFSEIDDRIVGRFDCSTIAGTYQFEEDAEATEMNKRGELAINSLSYTSAKCELPSDRTMDLTNQNERVGNFLNDGTLFLSDSGNILFLKNAGGESLMYRARPDALDGVIRPFRVIATGDRLGTAFDEVTATSTMIVYDSLEDFQNKTPNLATEYRSDIADVDFSRETLIGLFIEPLEYLGPTIRGNVILERADSTEVQFNAFGFWCDNGFGQPRGDNAPFELIAIASLHKPVQPYGIYSSACP